MAPRGAPQVYNKVLDRPVASAQNCIMLLWKVTR